MRSEAPLLSIIDLSLGYKSGQTLIKNLNLKVTKPQLIALVGANGAGKSTLLRTISGLQKYSTGDVQVQGQSLNQLSVKALARLVSVVLTGQESISFVKVAELIAMGRSPHTGWLGNFTELDQQKVASAIKQTDILHLLGKSIFQLSDGERQKVMIARALAQDTPLMILDEPTTHLDIGNRVNIIQLLRSLVRMQQKCIIFSTHDIELALQTADQLWLIHNQSIINQSPEDLVLSGKLSETMGTEQAPFDSEIGTFKVQQVGCQPVTIKGSGNHLQWTQRALERAGYRLNSDSSVSVEVISGKKWMICQHDQLVDECPTIASLLDRLSELEW